MAVTHPKVSAKSDSSDTTRVQPSDWNDDHVLSGGANGALLHRDTAASDGMNLLADVAAGQLLTSGGVGEDPAYSAQPAMAVGSGTQTGYLPKIIHLDATAASSPADTNENTLWSFPLPANTLTLDNRSGLRIRVCGSFAANTNNKTAKLYFGTYWILIGTNSLVAAPNGTTFDFDVLLTRTGAATQVATSRVVVGLQAYALKTAPEATLTGAVTIKLTATAAAGAGGDILYQSACIEVVEAPAPPS